MEYAELSRPALPKTEIRRRVPDARPHKESWEAWGPDDAEMSAPSPPAMTAARPDLRTPVAFGLLCFSSVAMTLGNKWLMTLPELRPHTELLVIVQNSVAVCVMGVLTLLGAVRVSPVSRRQAAYFTWDALVLAVQTFTSLRALQHLSVSANTICRVLAIPTVAWLERLILGTRLAPARHACGWLVVAGALLYAREDLSLDATASTGDAWGLANLAAFCSNSVIDKMFMSQAEQTASGSARGPLEPAALAPAVG
jgi:uncharacterized membrane protein